MSSMLMTLEDRRLLSTIVENNPTDFPRRGPDRPAPGDRPGEHCRGDETIVFDMTVFKQPKTITLTGGQGLRRYLRHVRSPRPAGNDSCVVVFSATRPTLSRVMGGVGGVGDRFVRAGQS
jgi:hypothetical protein